MNQQKKTLSDFFPKKNNLTNIFQEQKDKLQKLTQQFKQNQIVFNKLQGKITKQIKQEQKQLNEDNQQQSKQVYLNRMFNTTKFDKQGNYNPHTKEFKTPYEMAQLRDKSTYRPNDSMKIELNKIKLSKFVNFTNEPVVRQGQLIIRYKYNDVGSIETKTIHSDIFNVPLSVYNDDELMVLQTAVDNSWPWSSNKLIQMISQNYDFLNQVVNSSYLQLIEYQVIRKYDYSRQMNPRLIKNKATYIKDRILNNVHDIIFKREDQCVIDYVQFQLQQLVKSKQIRSSQICDENLMKIFGMKDIKEGVSIDQMLNLCNYFPVSIYAFDQFGMPIHKESVQNSHLTLVFYINSEHVYPIIDKKMKQSIVKKDQISYLCDQSMFQYTDETQIYNVNKHEKNTEYNTKYDVILFDERTTDMEALCNEVMINEQMLPAIKIMSDGHIKAFQNPKTKQIYQSSSYFKERKQLCNNLLNEFKIADFKFVDQSYTMIGQTLFDKVFGSYDQIQSYLNEEQYNIFDQYPINAYIIQTNNQYDQTFLTCIDINKCYPNSLLTMEEDFCIYSRFDDVQIFEIYDQILPGEYYVNKTIDMGFEIVQSNGFYPYNFIIYCLDNKFITKNDIKYKLLASKTVNNNAFKPFIEYIFKNMNKNDSKSVANMFIGQLATKYIKDDKASITTSWDMVLAMQQSYTKKNYSVCVNDFKCGNQERVYYVKCSSRQPKLDKSCLPINRQIIAQSIIQLHKMAQNVISLNKEAKIISYNTDSMIIENPIKVYELNEQMVNYEFVQKFDYMQQAYINNQYRVKKITNDYKKRDFKQEYYDMIVRHLQTEDDQIKEVQIKLNLETSQFNLQRFAKEILIKMYYKDDMQAYVDELQSHDQYAKEILNHIQKMEELLVNDINKQNKYKVKQLIEQKKIKEAQQLQLQMQPDVVLVNDSLLKYLGHSYINKKTLKTFCEENEAQLFKDLQYHNIGNYKIEYNKLPKGNLLIKELVQKFDYKYDNIKWNVYDEKLTEKTIEFLKNNNCCILGSGGSGKTQLISEIYNKDEDILISNTNSAVQMLQVRCKDQTYTVDLFLDHNMNKKLMVNTKRIIIDECMMLSKQNLYSLVNLQKRYKNIKLLFVGDFRQIPAIGDNQFKMYHETRYFNKICNQNMIQVEYKPEFARYDVKLFNYLEEFYNTGYLNKQLVNKKEKECQRNICVTNKKVNEINNKFWLKHGSKYQVGMPLLCNDNFKKEGVYKNQFFKITCVSSKNITICLEELNQSFKFNQKFIQKNFVLAYAHTIHKSQGLTINEDYCIHELDNFGMNKNVLYTALSRGKSIKNIFFQYTNKKFEQFQYIQCIKQQMTSNLQCDDRYKQSKIYKIVQKNNKDDKEQLLYIGQTILSLKERMNQHYNQRFSLKDQFHQFLKSFKKTDETWIEIQLYKDYPCNNKMELLQEEYGIINQLKPIYNNYNKSKINIKEEKEQEDNKLIMLNNDLKLEFKDLLIITDYPEQEYYKITGKLHTKQNVMIRYKKIGQEQGLIVAELKKKELINQYLGII